MNEKVEHLILEQISALRSGSQLADARLKELWDEGLESGVAGDVDEVFDHVLKTLESARDVI